MPLTMVLTMAPSIIRIGVEKQIVSGVVDRSSHKEITPCVGGIAITLGILFSILVMTPSEVVGELQYITAAILIVFMVGFMDDLKDLTASYKAAGQILALSIVVIMGVRLESFYGLFYQYWEFHKFFSILLSGFTILVIVNGFNLIDGINGLAGTVGTIACCSFGVWFYITDNLALSVLAMSTAGSLLGYMRYNMEPAKTFMGDSGSLVVGLVLGVLAVEFIDTASTAELTEKYRFTNPVAICIAILIVPLFDTFRVFSVRLLRGLSPMQADRRHVHHLLVDAGLTHLEATTALGLYNLTIISLAYYLDPLLDLHFLILIIVGVTTSISTAIYLKNKRNKRTRETLALNQKA
ncbi:hypothetical protein A3850_000250 [Lewinella sp. 4G2]|nr:hypothetical protein A3850_000250 [Lewinella sp. 4G2]